jgi:hypothetical protein
MVAVKRANRQKRRRHTHRVSLNLMSKRIGSILHGAYGDYYWQATSLKQLAQKNFGTKLYLFAASPSRREILQLFDFSFAECFSPWQDFQKTPVDEVVQYQVFDRDLQSDVLAHLPAELLAKIDRTQNRIFWNDLKGHLPLNSTERLSLTVAGQRETEFAMQEYGIPTDLFHKRLTIGFVWRYRVGAGAIKPFLQPPAEVLVEKYSRAFRKLIEEFDCHVLITGMNLKTDDSNRHRVDAKYATFGLDLPAERCTYLRGRNWVADLEIISRCTVAAAMGSGISEALDTHRGGGVVLLDPPLHYMLVLLKYKVQLFNYLTPRGLWRAWSRPQSARRIHAWLAEKLNHAGQR